MLTAGPIWSVGGASRSPWLHEGEAQAQGLALSYTLFDFAALKMDESDLAAQLAAAEAGGYAGLNITYPYKQAIIGLLDELSAEAEHIGAVNTVKFASGRRVGHNTDVVGFAESLMTGMIGCPITLPWPVGKRCSTNPPAAWLVRHSAPGDGPSMNHRLLRAIRNVYG